MVGGNKSDGGQTQESDGGNTICTSSSSEEKLFFLHRKNYFFSMTNWRQRRKYLHIKYLRKNCIDLSANQTARKNDQFLRKKWEILALEHMCQPVSYLVIGILTYNAHNDMIFGYLVVGIICAENTTWSLSIGWFQTVRKSLWTKLQLIYHKIKLIQIILQTNLD